MNNQAIKQHQVQQSLFDDLDLKVRQVYKIWVKNVPLLLKKTDLKIMEGILFKKSSKNGFWKQSTYQLFGSKLIKIQAETGKPKSFTNTENQRLERIKLEEKGETKYGFRLTNNGKFVELYARNQDHMNMWFDELKQQCILTTYNSDFNTIKLMGKGNFARVYYARSKLSKDEFAVKAFEKDKFQSLQVDREALIKEISILRKMNHPGVIKMYQVYEDQSHVFLVNEMLKGGELFHKLKDHNQFDEVYVGQLMTNLLNSINYISHLDILHRDIKPENLILRSKDNDTDVCLADFGLADYYDPTGGYMFQRCGTPGYVAPEVLQDKIYDFKVDSFSAGVIMFILLTGCSPFKGKSYDQIVINNYNCTIDFSYKNMNKCLSPECLDLLQNLLKKEPSERYSAQQALDHPWFTKLKGQIQQQQKSQMNSFQSFSSNDGDQHIVRIAPKDNLQLKSKTPLMNSKWESPQSFQSPDNWKKQTGQNRNDYFDSPLSNLGSNDSPQVKIPAGTSSSCNKFKNESQATTMQSVPELNDEYDIDPMSIEDVRSPVLENMMSLQKYDLNNKNSKRFKEDQRPVIQNNASNVISGPQVNTNNFNVQNNYKNQTKSIREKLIQNV